ncbi:hypothetical protein BDZ85DRAFT_108585 [Elsinoe ampelina]|uniref:Uncharacterized protein n=1 Tax=Elsinoe ampelina TaxID=302913 RepID=A0A6A6GCD7_9PEZI|nr:hypothetical protein BDZ85DRAFT_108585 [Elsinoe ampelina]
MNLILNITLSMKNTFHRLHNLFHNPNYQNHTALPNLLFPWTTSNNAIIRHLDSTGPYHQYPPAPGICPTYNPAQTGDCNHSTRRSSTKLSRRWRAVRIDTERRRLALRWETITHAAGLWGGCRYVCFDPKAGSSGWNLYQLDVCDSGGTDGGGAIEDRLPGDFHGGK